MLLDNLSKEELTIYLLNKEIASLKLENADLKKQLEKHLQNGIEPTISNYDQTKEMLVRLLDDTTGQYRLRARKFIGLD